MGGIRGDQSDPRTSRLLGWATDPVIHFQHPPFVTTDIAEESTSLCTVGPKLQSDAVTTPRPGMTPDDTVSLTMLIDSLLSRLTRATADFVKSSPLLYYPVRNLIAMEGGSLVQPSTTDITIEGFPRSANTFAVNAFRYAQPERPEIANHTHAPAQVIKSVKNGIPCILLIRDPIDAAVSLAIREQTESMGELLNSYVRFYDPLIEYVPSLVIGSFEDVTTDYGEVIERVNAKYHTNFSVFDHTESNVEAVFDIVQRSADVHDTDIDETDDTRERALKTGVPTRQKEVKKRELRDHIRSDEFHEQRTKAHHLYERIIEMGDG